ncbi:protein kinase domain-containing protein [Theileria equi strain WA]|uniref:Protein kinase domain-containing protein n=1 Tax=Theileria equi strain WA TaxID=1537102 RepID=L0B295_THEEQ|nr:protein kinase domain-containing protein [Theileria equi strain WA]AFZ81249.1 protein kinase domain-containing protein [Theileria equi strain WA]|eukprot:XP_004830915.1 protein kinase domain-containing protein [Theileria equi strain WA]
MQPVNLDEAKAHLREGHYGDEHDEKITSRTSTLDTEGRYFDASSLAALRAPGHKKIRRLSAGSKLSSYYYIGAELRICSDCVKKSSSRPLLRDIIDRKTGEPKILKIISKSRIPPGIDSLNNWRTLCEKLLNMPPMPNLMRIDQIWESETSFYIVTEKFIGGELFEYLLKEKAIPEDICKYIFRQILYAVDTLHSMNLLHRDIKPENIMFRNPTKSILPIPERYELALIDFDTCKMTDSAAADRSEIVNGKRRLVGTYGYLAPEILRGDDYSTASDLWSVGIVLYILMTGIPPISMDKMYDAKASHAVLAAAEANGIDFNTPPLIEFPLARDLCKRLLCFDKHKRISSAADALAHPWLAGLPSIFDCALRLRNYNNQHRRGDNGFKDNNNNFGHRFGNFKPGGSSQDKKSGDGSKYKQSGGQQDNMENNDPAENTENKTSGKRDINAVYENDSDVLKTKECTRAVLIQSLTTNAESIEGIFKKPLRRKTDVQRPFVEA